jgi:hypothetical protein
MDILSGAVEFFSSAGLSSIVGMVGGYLAKRQEVKLKREEYKHDLEMAEMGIREMTQEHKNNIDMASKGIEASMVEGEIDIERGDQDAFIASIKSDSKMIGAIKWVRPGLTIYILIAVSVLTAAIWLEVGGLDAFGQNQLITIMNDIVETALYLCVLSLSWWFGSRGGNMIKR